MCQMAPVKEFLEEIEKMLRFFTVGEAVRSTCGNSNDEEEDDRFHLSIHQTNMTI